MKQNKIHQTINHSIAILVGVLLLLIAKHPSINYNLSLFIALLAGIFSGYGLSSILINLIEQLIKYGEKFKNSTDD